MSTTTFQLPKRFWEDHVDRGLWLDEDEYGRDGYGKDVGRHYEVELTDQDIKELLSDANYYAFHIAAGMDLEGRRYNMGLISSARAIVKRLSP